MMIKSSTLCCLAAFTGTLISLAPAARAQNAVSPAVEGRLSWVELRDTSLADALELIYRASGNPAHIIDESAQRVMIPSFSVSNIAWENAVFNLTKLNGFKVSRNESGALVVEPRNPVPAGSGGAGGLPFGSSPSAPSSLPSNPFGGGPRTEAQPSIRTFSNAQTLPGGDAGTSTSTDKSFHVLVIRHLYAGGFAKLFKGGTIISTESFISPPPKSGNGNGSNNNRNNNNNNNNNNNANNNNNNNNGGLFGGSSGGSSGGLFGNDTSGSSGGLFGNDTSNTNGNNNSGGLFGGGLF